MSASLLYMSDDTVHQCGKECHARSFGTWVTTLTYRRSSDWLATNCITFASGFGRRSSESTLVPVASRSQIDTANGRIRGLVIDRYVAERRLLQHLHQRLARSFTLHAPILFDRDDDNLLS